MNARATAIAFAVLAIVLTVAQDVFPARDWYHGWQYITVLAIAIVVMTVNVWRIWRGRATGKRFALALVGAIAVGVAGLLSGLIGPDTVTVIGTPGTVTPVPDLNAAAFFAATDPQALARGDASVTLRKRDGTAIAVGTRPVPVDLSVAFTQTKPAAYVIARDGAGNRLTVTQPSNPSFMSPVIIFRQSQDIHGHTFPLDTIAVPCAHRVVRVLYFGAADLAELKHDAKVTQAGAILSVSDERGAQRGLTMAASGVPVEIDGIHFTVTLGSYPVLNVASAPQPLVTIAGVLLFLGAFAWALIAPRKASPASEAAAAQPL